MSQYTLGVHLQILLAVGLAVFCYCLVLGCILCCRRRRKSVSSEDKEAVFLSPHPPQRVTVTLTPSPRTQPVKQQYEELDGDVLEFPSSKSSSSPSEDDLTALPFDPSPTRAAELVQSPGTSFPMRRLSTPAVPCSPNKRASPGRASLPSLTKLSLVSKSRRAMGRRSTVSGESFLYSESSHLTAAAARSPTQQGEASTSQYGSNTLSIPSKSAPLLHFSLLFSSACGTLVVNILGLSGASRRRSGVFVRASLPPLCPSPQQIASRRRSLSPDFHNQSFVLQVGSVEELCTCTLRLAVYSRDFSGLREAALGVVELPCEQMEWEPDTTTTYTRQLSPTKSKLKKSVSTQEALGHRKSSVCVPRALGQLFILLQYQTLAQRIKVMVRKAEKLAKLTRIPGAAGIRAGPSNLYECERKGLSSPGELQAAIDSNRREGRRPSYSSSLFRFSPSPSTAPHILSPPKMHLSGASGALNGLQASPGPSLKKDDLTPSIMAARPSMALALGQQQVAGFARAATLEQLREKLETGVGEGPERKMARLAEEQQRLMQQAFQHNLLAMASQIPMNLRLGAPTITTREEKQQDMSLSISTNGNASITVSVEVNGTIYSGTLFAQKSGGAPGPAVSAAAAASASPAGTSTSFGFSAPLAQTLSPTS